jgi:hypothetical protein
MPAAVLTPEAWAEVRRASEAGVDDETLSAQYNVKRDAIRKRRSVEKWITPARIAEAAETERIKAKYKVTNSRTISQVSQGLDVAGMSMEDMGREGVLLATRGLLPIIRETFDPETSILGPARNIKEASTLIGAFMKASGLDKPQTAVQVNLGFSSKSGSQHWLDSSQVVEVEDDE